MGAPSKQGTAAAESHSGLDRRDARRGTPACRFHRAAHVQQAEHAGTIILFDKQSYFTLPEGVAADLWGLLEQPRSAEELVDQIHEQYDAPREIIAADVAAQLARLRRARLIVLVEPCAGSPSRPQPWWRLWGRGR